MLHPFKVVAFAVVAACAASMAAAQNPGDVSNTTTAGTATAETLERSRFRRQLPPPGGWPAPQYQRVCAWRADGLPVTGEPVRTNAPVEGGTCDVSQDAPLNSTCRCGGRTGNVIDILL